MTRILCLYTIALLTIVSFTQCGGGSSAPAESNTTAAKSKRDSVIVFDAAPEQTTDATDAVTKSASITKTAVRIPAKTPVNPISNNHTITPDPNPSSGTIVNTKEDSRIRPMDLIIHQQKLDSIAKAREEAKLQERTRLRKKLSNVFERPDAPIQPSKKPSSPNTIPVIESKRSQAVQPARAPSLPNNSRKVESAPAPAQKETATPDPAVTQKSTPEPVSGKATKERTVGKLARTVPDTMPLNKWTTVSIRITRDKVMGSKIDPNDKSSLVHDMTQDQIKETVVVDLSIGAEMSAKLVGGDFDIQAITPEVQNIEPSDNTFTEWSWQVKPKHKGSLPLVISISITQDINGNKLTKSVEVYNDSIKVFASRTNSLLFGLGGGFIILLCTAGIWYRKRKNKKVLASAAPVASTWLNSSTKDPKSIFIAYAEQDEQWASKLYNHLLSLARNGYITIWYEKLILAGSDRVEIITKHIQDADMILFVVSADFFASDVCDDIINKSIAKAKTSDTLVVPIVVRKCHWEMTSLNAFTVLPQNQKAISSEWNNSDEAIYQVVEEMQMLIREHDAKKK